MITSLSRSGMFGNIPEGSGSPHAENKNILFLLLDRKISYDPRNILENPCGDKDDVDLGL